MIETHHEWRKLKEAFEKAEREMGMVKSIFERELMKELKTIKTILLEIYTQQYKELHGEDDDMILSERDFEASVDDEECDKE